MKELVVSRGAGGNGKGAGRSLWPVRGAVVQGFSVTRGKCRKDSVVRRDAGGLGECAGRSQ